jgi:hypothetical protein
MSPKKKRKPRKLSRSQTKRKEDREAGHLQTEEELMQFTELSSTAYGM